jgi:hypothetical protein
MTDAMTSQYIDLSSWDTVYNYQFMLLGNVTTQTEYVQDGKRNESFSQYFV